jgi:hypothetical protein
LIEDFTATTPGNADRICDPGETCVPEAELEDRPGPPVVRTYFKTFDPALFPSTTDWQERIGVTHMNLGPPGIDGDSLVVVFLAEPNTGSIVSAFSASKGIWSVQVDLRVAAGAIRAIVHRPRPVLQIGDKIGCCISPAPIVTGLMIYDPVANAPFDSGGIARVPVAGDHRVAFWASTTADQYILRGSHLDTDGDGLLDHWETVGIDYDGDGAVDLNLVTGGIDPVPANPRHKDLYLEIDYMETAAHTHRPGFHPTTKARLAGSSPITNVIAAFANSPVPNLDGVNGVSLHVLVDESMSEVTPLPFAGGLDRVKLGTGPCDPTPGHLGPLAARLSANCVNIIGARRLVYRYAVFAHEFSLDSAPATPLPFSGATKARSDSLIIALSAGAPASPTCSPTSDHADSARCLAAQWRTTFDSEWKDIQQGTLMHEFGHSLGLLHGGNDDVNFKPNYFSVMNYALQTNEAGVQTTSLAAAPDCRLILGVMACRTGRPLDYSSNGISVDENSLHESAGIPGAPAGRRGLSYVGMLPVVGLASMPFDFNLNGTIEPGSYGQDVNKDATRSVLHSFDDWANLVYTFRDAALVGYGAGLTVGPLQRELTADEIYRAGVALPFGSSVSLPGDVNSDGVVNCDDLRILRASFGKRSGAPGFDARADVNSDNIVDIRDLAFVSRNLPVGTTCP